MKFTQNFNVPKNVSAIIETTKLTTIIIQTTTDGSHVTKQEKTAKDLQAVQERLFEKMLEILDTPTSDKEPETSEEYNAEMNERLNRAFNVAKI